MDYNLFVLEIRNKLRILTKTIKTINKINNKILGIRRNLMEVNKELQDKIYDLIIIGSGPAGMTASIYASRGGLDVMMLDYVPGGKLNTTSEIENWPGEVSILGPDLAQKMATHSVQFGAVQEFGHVENIVDEGAIKKVETFDKIYQAKSVLIATGTVERKLGIPGEEEHFGKGVSYCTICDAAFFREKPVTIIGGGDSAYTAADYMARFSDQVHLVLRRDTPRAENILQDRVNKNKNVKIHYSYSPVEIQGTDGKVSRVFFKNNKDERADLVEVNVDAIFPQIGAIPNTGFIRDLPILDEEGYIIVDSKMRTSVPGIFAAGDVIQKELRQIVTATGDGSIAGEEISDYVLNQMNEA